MMVKYRAEGGDVHFYVHTGVELVQSSAAVYRPRFCPPIPLLPVPSIVVVVVAMYLLPVNQLA
jgi:hypothetical protein